MNGTRKDKASVGFFVTCLVDLFRPGVGFAAVELLEAAGCEVSVPQTQTCCGQPAYNSGDRANAQAIARQVVDAFAEFDYVVAPSGSCAAMISEHYPRLLDGDPDYEKRARAIAGRTFELTAFLVDVLAVSGVDADFEGRLAFQDTCSALRELGIAEQPRKLLGSLGGAELCDVGHSETCCGFGGLFSVKYSDISAEMARRKSDDILAAGAGTVVGLDLGCLMNVAGKLKRDGHAVKVRHIAEVLAGRLDGPAIGEGET